MLLEICIGDCYGRPFEFATREFIKANNDVKEYKHREGELKTGIGTYTDDTQMSIAIAEHMLSGAPSTQIRYAKHFVDAYKRDPRGGYSKRIRTALEETNPRFPFEFLIKCKPQGMSSNGSVMRTIPLGLLPDTKDIIHRCMLHTSATHGSIEAFNATVAVALTAHYFYHYVNPLPFALPQDLIKYQDWMREQMGPSYNQVIDSYTQGEELPCDAMKTASCAIKLAWEYNEMSHILFKAIECGGDVDSSASIAMGLASLRGVKNLPESFYDNIENGEFGRKHLMNLDTELFKKYPKNGKPEIEGLGKDVPGERTSNDAAVKS